MVTGDYPYYSPLSNRSKQQALPTIELIKGSVFSFIMRKREREREKEKERDRERERRPGGRRNMF